MTDNGSGGGVTCDADGHVVEGPCNYNAGMRGIKGSPYDGGHRVPFILRYPRLLGGAGGGAGGAGGGGRDCDVLTSYVDFMPSMLELCGVDVAPPRPFHGASLVPLMLPPGDRGGGGGRETGAEPKWAARAMVTDTQRVPRPVKWRNSCVMQGKLRMIDGKELYDLSVDRGQVRDMVRVLKYPMAWEPPTNWFALGVVLTIGLRVI
jgi:arylsulfatase A-like enzyme